MRVSGRSGSETLMFIAPALIFGGFLVWLYGDPKDLLRYLDRTILRAGYAAYAWLAGWLA